MISGSNNFCHTLCTVWSPFHRKKILIKGNNYAISFFDVLLTVHLKIFFSVFNQFVAQNLFHNKFYFKPLHVSSTCAHHQEVKIVYTTSGIITPIGVMIPEAV